MVATARGRVLLMQQHAKIGCLMPRGPIVCAATVSRTQLPTDVMIGAVKETGLRQVHKFVCHLLLGVGHAKHNGTGSLCVSADGWMAATGLLRTRHRPRLPRRKGKRDIRAVAR